MSILGDEKRKANVNCFTFVASKPERSERSEVAQACINPCFEMVTLADANAERPSGGAHPCRNHLKTLLEIGDTL